MSKVKVEIDADLQDLIPQFVENRKKDIESLDQLVEQNDLPAVAALAHKIKGAAAGYGFAELSELAAQMEKSAKNNESGPLKDLVKKMRIHFLNVEIHYVSM
ncbi:Hpt domain-containing protein [Bdellovibrio sp. 22V]|uniref:Hpt domain-containing protein n=1 Tax=Bdellovibrio TaxID=958 RepID=UPI002542C917|nr:Hpt domain-containing protein [Bdellovibrio sp. 22V]WII72121.1 Hpt domain-containing protein [Bdellovibrio sp. 22V]